MVIMGSLHIEMALLNVIGDWLDGSAWLEVCDDLGQCCDRGICRWCAVRFTYIQRLVGPSSDSSIPVHPSPKVIHRLQDQFTG